MILERITAGDPGALADWFHRNKDPLYTFIYYRAGHDPELAAEWANALVAQLNDYLRQQAIDTSNRNLEYLEEELGRTTVAEIQLTIFGLIGEEQKAAMLANSQKEFAFRVLDAAAAPDRKVRPKRALIGVLTTFVAGVLMVVIVVGQFAYANSVGRARD